MNIGQIETGKIEIGYGIKMMDTKIDSITEVIATQSDLTELVKNKIDKYIEFNNKRNKKYRWINGKNRRK